MKKPLLLALATTLVAVSAGFKPAADEPKGIDGTWNGAIKVQGIDLRVVLKVESAKEGSLKATFTSPDQSPDAIPIDKITEEKGEVRFEIKAINGSYLGKLTDSKTEIKGDWTQGGQSFPLTLKKGEAPSAVAAPKELAGLWEGKLKLQAGLELRIVLRVEKTKESGDALVASLVSPDQTPQKFAVTKISLDKDVVEFEVKTLGASYKGKLNEKKTETSGDFKQGPGSHPLTLKKTDKLSELRRPQTPKGPFPYEAEEVTYENVPGKVKLAGTLTLPKGKGPFPAVVLITGSGAQDRDESLLGHKPFLVLADDLSRRGIAVLRVDDRGVGGSTGDVSSATSQDFAGDVLAGVDYLKKRPEIDPKKIGLIGHSEGGMIAPIVAAGSKDVAFIVLMAGTGLNGEEILAMQGALIAKAMGASDEVIAMNRKLQHEVIAILRDETDAKVALKKAGDLLKQRLPDFPEEARKEIGDVEKFAESQIKQMNTPWFRYFLTYDPRTALAKVKCPVLAIVGENDLQVPPKENLHEIEKALKDSGNTRVTIKELPGLNHLFQTSKTGSPAEYAAIEETIAPDALKLIGDWITDQVGKKE